MVKVVSLRIPGERHRSVSHSVTLDRSACVPYMMRVIRVNET